MMLPHTLDSSSHRPASTPGPLDAHVQTGTTPLVLVVDDNEDIRDALVDVLDLAGYSVRSAAHGAEALEMLRQCRPALIVLDLMMPVMDGPTFIAAKSRDPTISGIPILAITAATQLCVEGASAFMRKPFNLDSFLSAVARCVAGRREGV